MKKILLTTLIIILSTCTTQAACKIKNIDSCKADIGSGINDKLNDKILPNNLDQKIRPNNTFNYRTKLGQPNVPQNINMEPAQEENTQPYNADCQFGNCVNRGNSGKKNNP